MGIRFWSAIIALTVTCVPALAQPGKQLLTPGLDADADGDGLPDGWTRYVRYFGTASVAVDRQVRRSGDGAVRVELGDNSRCALSQYIAVADPGPYTFAAWFRAETATGAPVQAAINWFDASDWPVRLQLVRQEPASTALLTTTDWTAVAAVGTRPEGADTAQVALVFGDGSTPAAMLWADDASFSPGARPWPLVTNAGMEAVGPGGLPAAWSRGGEGQGFEMVRDANEFHTGAASLRLTGLPDHGSRVCAVQMTPVFPTPRRLRVSLWYKGAGTADGIVDVLPPPDVKARDGGVYYDRIVFSCPTPQTEWRQFVVEQETTPEAREAGLMRLQFLLYQKGDGDLWYDDVAVELLN